VKTAVQLERKQKTKRWVQDEKIASITQAISWRSSIKLNFRFSKVAPLIISTISLKTKFAETP